MLKKIIKEQLLLEKKIADIKANLIISYDLRHDERSTHSQRRKWRHVSDSDTGEIIHDLYIQNLIEAAKDDITMAIVMEEIQDGVRFIVSQKNYPHLNAIIEPKMQTPYMWILYVISVMNKENFAVGRDQLQIFATSSQSTK